VPGASPESNHENDIIYCCWNLERQKDTNCIEKDTKERTRSWGKDDYCKEATQVKSFPAHFGTQDELGQVQGYGWSRWGDSRIEIQNDAVRTSGRREEEGSRRATTEDWADAKGVARVVINLAKIEGGRKQKNDWVGEANSVLDGANK